MGKGAVYVVLFLLTVVVLVAAGRGVYLLARRWLRAHRQHQRAILEATTPWTHYVRIGRDGDYRIGVQRATVYRDQLLMFEGPIQMFSLASDESSLNVEDKTNLARDKAALNNTLKANSHD